MYVCLKMFLDSLFILGLTLKMFFLYLLMLISEAIEFLILISLKFLILTNYYIEIFFWISFIKFFLGFTVIIIKYIYKYIISICYECFFFFGDTVVFLKIKK